MHGCISVTNFLKDTTYFKSHRKYNTGRKERKETAKIMSLYLQFKLVWPNAMKSVKVLGFVAKQMSPLSMSYSPYCIYNICQQARGKTLLLTVYVRLLYSRVPDTTTTLDRQPGARLMRTNGHHTRTLIIQVWAPLQTQAIISSSDIAGRPC